MRLRRRRPPIRLEVLWLHPGDVLIVESDKPLSQIAVDRIRFHVGVVAPGVQVLVFDNGMRVKAMRPVPLPATPTPGRPDPGITEKKGTAPPPWSP